MTVELASLQAWVGAALWTLARVSGLLLAAPVFSAMTVPRMVRGGLAVLLTVVLAPTVAVPAGLAPLSAPGLAVLAQQLLIGAAMGFVLRLVVEAASFGGQLVAFAMGLSYGEVVDPLKGVTTPVLSQFYSLLATLLLLATNAHLRLLDALGQSFHELPVGAGVFSSASSWALLLWAGRLFSGALTLALPALAALLVVNVGVAVTSRAAPALNLFAIGFPAILLLGLVVLWFTLGSLPGAVGRLLDDAFNALSGVLASRH